MDHGYKGREVTRVNGGSSPLFYLNLQILYYSSEKSRGECMCVFHLLTKKYCFGVYRGQHILLDRSMLTWVN